MQMRAVSRSYANDALCFFPFLYKHITLHVMCEHKVFLCFYNYILLVNRNSFTASWNKAHKSVVTRSDANDGTEALFISGNYVMDSEEAQRKIYYV